MAYGSGMLELNKNETSKNYHKLRKRTCRKFTFNKVNGASNDNGKEYFWVRWVYRTK